MSPVCLERESQDGVRGEPRSWGPAVAPLSGKDGTLANSPFASAADSGSEVVAARLRPTSSRVPQLGLRRTRARTCAAGRRVHLRTGTAVNLAVINSKFKELFGAFFRDTVLV